eukprot:scaffold114196_cov63-Phaeocystis_antarctica.AAC.4
MDLRSHCRCAQPSIDTDLGLGRAAPCHMVKAKSLTLPQSQNRRRAVGRERPPGRAPVISEPTPAHSSVVRGTTRSYNSSDVLSSGGECELTVNHCRPLRRSSRNGLDTTMPQRSPYAGSRRMPASRCSVQLATASPDGAFSV